MHLFIEWLDLNETLRSQPDSVWHYLQDSISRTQLDEIASAEPCRAAAYARGMIYLADRDTIPYWPPIPIDSSIVPRSGGEDSGIVNADFNAYHHISIIPNPVSNEFTFFYPVRKSETDVLRIFSIAGEKIWHQLLLAGDKHQFNIAELSPGIYVGVITSGDKHSQHIFRFVKLAP